MWLTPATTDSGGSNILKWDIKSACISLFVDVSWQTEVELCLSGPWAKLSRRAKYIRNVNEFRCYEAKIEECEKAGSRRESNPGHLCQCSANWATTAGQPPALTILCRSCICFRKEVSCRPLMEFRWHILSGYQVCDWGIQYHLCTGGSSQRCFGFNSRRLPAFSLSSIFTS